jgi:uncharacterized membrane protein (UPF0127 family)
LAAVVLRRVILRLPLLFGAVGLAIALVALPACKNAGEQKPAATAAPTPPRTGTVVVHTGHGQLTFHVELAITNAEHERGLMFRTHLDDDAGMLFLFERPSQQTFWMKNTLIPLDMIFIGADHRIVGVVAKAEPRTETPRFVPGVSQFVLELAGGVSAERNLGAGDLVEFKGVDAP